MMEFDSTNIEDGTDLVRNGVKGVLEWMKEDNAAEATRILRVQIREQVINALSILLRGRFPARGEWPTPQRLNLEIREMREETPSPMIQRYGYELLDMFDAAVESRQWDAFFERVDEFEKFLIDKEWTIRDS